MQIRACSERLGPDAASGTGFDCCVDHVFFLAHQGHLLSVRTVAASVADLVVHGQDLKEVLRHELLTDEHKVVDIAGDVHVEEIGLVEDVAVSAFALISFFAASFVQLIDLAVEVGSHGGYCTGLVC